MVGSIEFTKVYFQLLFENLRLYTEKMSDVFVIFDLALLIVPCFKYHQINEIRKLSNQNVKKYPYSTKIIITIAEHRIEKK